ncbi:MAG TPA: FHA domain-containing protein, partial [Planctomycetota bacterium]|nr:FHA domain-containing protein [Planctomycetota bacterium]
MNQLVYTHEGRRVTVPLIDRPVSLGRGDAADHCLPDKTASRVHAQFILRDGKWCVEDLQSANGTLVNGKKIGGIVTLAPGDVVRIGATELKFEGEPLKPASEPEQEIPRLVFQPDPNAAPVVVLIRGRITIGRKPENSLQIDNKGVSGTHIEVVRAGRTCTLRDLESSNGTSVAGRDVRECVLNNGDAIVLGKVAKLHFIDPLAQPVPAASPGQPPAQPA